MSMWLDLGTRAIDILNANQPVSSFTVAKENISSLYLHTLVITLPTRSTTLNCDN